MIEQPARAAIATCSVASKKCACGGTVADEGSRERAQQRATGIHPTYTPKARDRCSRPPVSPEWRTSEGASMASAAKLTCDRASFPKQHFRAHAVQDMAPGTKDPAEQFAGGRLLAGVHLREASVRPPFPEDMSRQRARCVPARSAGMQGDTPHLPALPSPCATKPPWTLKSTGALGGLRRAP